MALTDKDIIITPNRGQTSEPKIDFKGASASLGPQTITLNVYPTDNGTLSFEGSAGQLFSITNSLTGTIFSVNDVSGIPSIEVLDTGIVRIAQYSGNVLVGTSTDTGAKFQVNGVIEGTDINSVSDEREKTNIVTIQNALEKVKALRGVEFDWIDSGKHSIGVIAQEIERIIPSVVYTSPDGSRKTVSYGNIVGLLIEAIKIQDTKITALDSFCQSQEERISKLEQLCSKLV